tara:strand:- start:15 stop:827 length:813 start_codon:yes stop_codon:yes gene_type:complete
MIITHKIPWTKCLSNQIWPAIGKGWKDEGRPTHFFWGLAGNNIKEIKDCIEKNEDWYYVDVGYLTKQITRYPEPVIHEYDKTYFRIVKGGIHTIRGKIGTGARLQKLESQGIDVSFKGWDTGDTKHILLCPSSPTVTYHINGITQDEWIKQVTLEIRKYTDREIRLRNKPRPNNQWWNTDIKDDLKGCHCLVTNMSLSAIDAILNQTPAITHQRNVASFITSKDISKIEKPMRSGHKTVNEWLKMITENQFTLEEIENGLAYETMMEQPQ